MPRLALYQPDIPQNAGTLMRLAACLGVPLDLIEPAGFDMSDRHLKRSGLDYLGHLDLVRHRSWEAFDSWRRGEGRRLVLATTHGSVAHHVFRYEPDDILLLGRESAGAPASVHASADARVAVPMQAGLRSLNIAVAAALILGEALRQTDAFPASESLAP